MTGELINNETTDSPVGTLHISPAAQERNRKYQEKLEEERKKQAEQQKKERYRSAKIEAEKELGNFIVIYFDRAQPQNKVKAETLARAAYLATFIRYGGELMLSQRLQMNKAGAKEVLHLPNSTFYRFWDEAVAAGIIQIDDKGLLAVSKDLFRKGKVPRYTGYNQGWAKIYVDQIRRLYELTKTTQHRYLGEALCMLPFISQRFNVVCRNPFETDIEKVEPLDMVEFCTTLGLDSKNAPALRKAYNQIVLPVNGKNQRFCTVVTSDDGKEMIFVNPRTVFMGDDWRYVEGLILYFSDRRKRRGKRTPVKLELPDSEHIPK